MSYYQKVDYPQDGQLVQYLAVYALRWPRESGGMPTCAFIEVDDPAIKAAPQLLEACKEALEYISETERLTTHIELWNMLTAAIAAAEGEP